MSEDLFYNRDRNISGITEPVVFSDLSLTPVYGSRVDFTSKILETTFFMLIFSINIYFIY